MIAPPYGPSSRLASTATRPRTAGNDIYATALRLLGFDPKRLTGYYDGLDRRLTDVQGRVLEELLA